MTSMQPTDLVEAPAWSIRPELPIDLDLIHEVHRAAFRGSAVAELVDAVRASAGFVPELSLVAGTDDGSVLGHIMLSLIGFQADVAEAAHGHVLALAPLGVLPPHWGRGIGSALTTAALALADTRDEPFVAVLGAPSFYARFGFTPAADAGIRSQYDAAGVAYQVRPLGANEVKPGFVVYPPSFSDV
jgi:putative acetyltransferase